MSLLCFFIHPVFCLSSSASILKSVTVSHHEHPLFLSPRSMHTWGFMSFEGGWFSRGEGWGKDTGAKAGKDTRDGGWRPSVGSAGGSSLMPLSVVQGDHRGDVASEEDSLPPSRASRKSSAVDASGLRVWGQGGRLGYHYTMTTTSLLQPHNHHSETST